MSVFQAGLGAAIAAVTGRAEERAIESLFSPGEIVDPSGFAGMDDWEVVGWFAILPRTAAKAA